MNRSYALEPVMSASLCAPPTASSSFRHSAVVDESIQTGESRTEKAWANSSCRNLSEIQKLTPLLCNVSTNSNFTIWDGNAATWIGVAKHISGADAPVDTAVLLTAPGDTRHVPEVDAFKNLPIFVEFYFCVTQDLCSV